MQSHKGSIFMGASAFSLSFVMHSRLGQMGIRMGQVKGERFAKEPCSGPKRMPSML